jgi:antagonist of KipI
MIEVVTAGPQTSIQDRGRFGWEHIGIPSSGATDVFSYSWANRLVGNKNGAATLECLLSGPVLRATQDLIIATCGVESPSIDGGPIEPWTAVRLPAGSVLSCEKLHRLRGYIAVQGGLDVPTVLGSRSTDLTSGFGGWQGRPLRSGDSIPIGSSEIHMPQELRCDWREWIDSPLELRVVTGPRVEELAASELAQFLKSTYRVSHQSSHVGVRLEGPSIETASHGSRISEPMPIGGIQITPAGNPVVLLAARGTIGGYPVVAVVITPDVWRLGQARPGDEVRFREVSFDQASEITRKAYEQLDSRASITQ